MRRGRGERAAREGNISKATATLLDSADIADADTLEVQAALAAKHPEELPLSPAEVAHTRAVVPAGPEDLQLRNGRVIRDFYRTVTTGAMINTDRALDNGKPEYDKPLRTVTSRRKPKRRKKKGLMERVNLKAAVSTPAVLRAIKAAKISAPGPSQDQAKPGLGQARPRPNHTPALGQE